MITSISGKAQKTRIEKRTKLHSCMTCKFEDFGTFKKKLYLSFFMLGSFKLIKETSQKIVRFINYTR